MGLKKFRSKAMSMTKIGTLNPHPFTDLLKLSNLEWAKCLGRMTLVNRYLSYDTFVGEVKGHEIDD